MKLFFSCFILVVFLMPLGINAQQIPDSLLQKQFQRQKLQLELSDDQFTSYQKISKKYLEKMGYLAGAVKDTIAFVRQANVRKIEYMADLKKILNAEQIDKCRKSTAETWKKFHENAKENHIKTSGNSSGNN